MIPFTWHTGIGKFTETESNSEVTGGWGKSGMAIYCLMGTAFLSGMTKVFWKWTVVMIAYNTVKVTTVPELCTENRYNVNYLTTIKNQHFKRVSRLEYTFHQIKHTNHQ